MDDIDILKKLEKQLYKKIITYKTNRQKQIIELNLSNNLLSRLPPEIGQLTNLQKLNLERNQLTSLPPEITQLTNLQALNLRGNQLTSLPPEIVQLTNLQELKLEGNLLQKPPLSIARQGIAAIRNYFRDLGEDSGFVYEAKLILVGEPGAGKTSLSKKLLNPEYELKPTEPMTKGIQINQWQFPYNKNITFTTHIWDFGGQEIMHATQLYFLTRRSVYVVLANNRKEDTDFYYWLNTVALFGGDSSVFIVLNEKFEYKKYIPEEITTSFENITDVLKINLADNTGLSDLAAAMQTYLKSLPHVEKEMLPPFFERTQQVVFYYQKDRPFPFIC